jgi:hypothetical protein
VEWECCELRLQGLLGGLGVWLSPTLPDSAFAYSR